MILSPLVSFKKPPYSPIVLDIETTSEGDLLAIDTAYREDFTDQTRIVHVRHDKWDQWYNWLLTFNVPRKRVWAHNGGGFDWLSFVDWYVKSDRKEKIYGNLAAGKLITLSVAGWELADSLNIFRCSLSKVAANYGMGVKSGSGKDAEKLYLTDRQAFERYLANDTEVLLLSLERFTNLLRENISPIRELGSTIASTAMRVYRTSFLQEPIYTPDDEWLLDLMREGYNGGRVEVFRAGKHNGVRVYDANSMYPSGCMHQPLPMSSKGYALKKRYKGASDGVVGVYRVKFRQNRKHKPLLMLGGTGEYSGEGVFYTPELDYFTSLGGKIEPIEGYAFTECDTILRPYMAYIYDLRKRNKENALGEVCKCLMNYLTGKFAQKSVRSSIELLPDLDSVKNAMKRGSVTPVSVYSDLYVIEQESRSACEFVAISGLITSASRVSLHKAFGKDVIYCDTDSVHTNGVFAGDVGPNLGQWKLETEANYGVYLGRKLYALRCKDGTDKIRAKGVSVGGDNGDDLKMEHYLWINRGNSRVSVYNSPPTIRRVLRGEKPCRFVPRKRTLRKTV